MESPFFIMLPLLFFYQLMILRALGNEWTGNYSQANICALEGSTVFINITYTYSTKTNVTHRFWTINPVKGEEPSDLCKEQGYLGRVEYLGEGQNQFSLKLSDVNKTDEHMYCLKIQGTRSNNNYLFYPGVTLSITDLRVESPEEVVEGNKTVFVCKTSCSLSNLPAFIWYKNGHPINTKQNKMNTLTLQPTKAEHMGSYKCAVRGYEQLCAPARTLSVKYRPKNVSISISPSGKILEGGSATLTCSGDANPPVMTYMWFKEATLVKKGKIYTISKISSEDSGEYKCKCTNVIGQQYSDGVTLSVVDTKSKVQTAAIACITMSLLLLSLVLIVLLFRRKKILCWSEERTVKHERHIAFQPTANDSVQENQNEIPYANIAYGENFNLVLSTSVQHQSDEAKEYPQEEEVQYSSVNISSLQKSKAVTTTQSSVIYSSVK